MNTIKEHHPAQEKKEEPTENTSKINESNERKEVRGKIIQRILKGKTLLLACNIIIPYLIQFACHLLGIKGIDRADFRLSDEEKKDFVELIDEVILEEEFLRTLKTKHLLILLAIVVYATKIHASYLKSKIKKAVEKTMEETIINDNGQEQIIKKRHPQEDPNNTGYYYNGTKIGRPKKGFEKANIEKQKNGKSNLNHFKPPIKSRGVEEAIIID